VGAVSAVPARLPLSTLLSQALVAFTIEFDNEAESRGVHSTTRGSAADAGGPWLVSQAMWANFMQYIDADGVPLAELEGLDRITNLAGMKRWGYITVAPALAGELTEPPRPDLVIRPTRAGRKAQAIWRPLAGEIEQRWKERFGDEQVGRLRESLEALVQRFDIELPQYLPVVAIHMFAGIEKLHGRVPPVPGSANGARPDLSVLLAKVLLMFTVDFEGESNLSLPTSANALRVLGEKGVRVRDLPRLTGVSKEAIAMSVGLLARLGCAVVESDPAASRGKVVRLTPKGRKAQEKYRRILAQTEELWRVRYGHESISRLRESLEALVGDATALRSPLFEGLQPHPDGWRASVRRPEMLPHYPMVLHRGGYPDGS
jgi:DNA-binding MarR family transcriptional regulator